ncbi:hypothetical protein OROMI_004091 [Orobanche minor]
MILMYDKEQHEPIEPKFHHVSDGECRVLAPSGLISDDSQPLNTLKLAGRFMGMTAVILIDGGATYNFISKPLALARGLPISPPPPSTSASVMVLGSKSVRFVT